MGMAVRKGVVDERSARTGAIKHNANSYNLCYREEEREMIPLCEDQGIGIIHWSPLARGFLTGKYKRDQGSDSLRYQYDDRIKERLFRPEDFDVVERVEEIAVEKGVKPVPISTRPEVTI